MSELVGGKSGWTPCRGSGFRCGSASPVCYLISVLGAARRCHWLRWICVGFRYSMRLGVVFVGIWSVLDSVFRAARRCLFVTRSRCSVRLGVSWLSWLLLDLGSPCGSASPGCCWISAVRAARRLLVVAGSWQSCSADRF